MSNRHIKIKLFLNKVIRKFPSRFRGEPSKLFIFAFILSYSANSIAYVGPGAGITMLGALWAVILGLVIAIGGFLVWPIRAFLRRRKEAVSFSAQEKDNESDKTNVE